MYIIFLSEIQEDDQEDLEDEPLDADGEGDEAHDTAHANFKFTEEEQEYDNHTGNDEYQVGSEINSSMLMIYRPG